MNTYDGQDLNLAVPLKTPTINYPIPNFPQLIVYTQEYAQKASKYQPPALGISHHLYKDAILAEEGQPTAMGGGLVRFSRQFVSLPNQIYKEPVVVSYTYPGKKVRVSWKREYTEDGTAEYKRVDNQTIREPQTMSVIGRKETEFINLLSPQFAQKTTEVGQNTPLRVGKEIVYPTIINGKLYIYINGKRTALEDLDSSEYQPLTAPPNGFDFSQVKIEPGFQVTAMRDVFTENGARFFFYGQAVGAKEEATDFLYDQFSTPTASEYKRMVDDQTELQVETTMLEQFKGTIYSKTRTFVKAR